jgi:hypothetical protein
MQRGKETKEICEYIYKTFKEKLNTHTGTLVNSGQSSGKTVYQELKNKYMYAPKKPKNRMNKRTT